MSTEATDPPSEESERDICCIVLLMMMNWPGSGINFYSSLGHLEFIVDFVLGTCLSRRSIESIDRNLTVVC